tara:strand:+ start:217 stop:588 length:372 start_codon:yes stop_codon:yes gene_type:complete
MNISDLYTTDLHADGAECEILDGEGNQTGLFITVMGVDSPVFRAEAKKQQKAYIEAIRNEKDFDDEKMSIDGLVAATVGWRGTDEEFSKKLCKELYSKAPYVKEQIDRFMADRANFTKAKPKS